MKRRKLLIWALFLLTVLNGLFLLYNFAARVKGHSFHTFGAAHAVVTRLQARGLLKMPEDDQEEWKLLVEAFVEPIEPHVDPFYNEMMYPLLFNMVTLGLLWIVAILPSRERPNKTFGAK